MIAWCRVAQGAQFYILSLETPESYLHEVLRHPELQSCCCHMHIQEPKPLPPLLSPLPQFEKSFCDLNSLLFHRKCRKITKSQSRKSNYQSLKVLFKDGLN